LHIALRAGFGRLSDFDPEAVPSEAERIESGTPSWLLLAGWKESLDLLLSIGAGAIERRVMELARHAQEAVRRAGLELLSPQGPPLASPIVVAGAGAATSRVHRALGRSGVITALRDGGIRIAPHFYNTESDMVRFETAARLALSEAAAGR
jgi:selenocysteine lyase/cysteine desulfurase